MHILSLYKSFVISAVSLKLFLLCLTDAAATSCYSWPPPVPLLTRLLISFNCFNSFKFYYFYNNNNNNNNNNAI